VPDGGDRGDRWPACALRGRVGPLTWAVLEEAALSVEVCAGDGSMWCRLSVRVVATRLAVGRDAAGRAVKVLVAGGMLRRDRGERVPMVASRRAAIGCTCPPG
jgi:hypothetical protein